MDHFSNPLWFIVKVIEFSHVFLRALYEGGSSSLREKCPYSELSWSAFFQNNFQLY